MKVKGKFPVNTLIVGLRSIGYSFPTAVADIIDNSISAGASKISVFSNPHVEDPYFAVLDNGSGMSKAELLNAMQFGSDRSKKTECELELGRYGLGLKSASLSQCRKFVVVTKQNNKTIAMSFDLDEVERSGELQYEYLSPSVMVNVQCYGKLNPLRNGTLVVWTRFDRLNASASDFIKSFESAVDDALRHTELVFHRFYDSIEIKFNNIRIAERDPFLLQSHPRQQAGRTMPIPVGESVIMVTPYVLPYANTLTTKEKALLGNPTSIYDDQGFYIYRNKRLILWGGWMRMGMRSELNKLARVCVDIPSSLDSLWGLDVKKSSARIPDSVKESIRIAVRDSNLRSGKVIKGNGVKETTAEHKVWERYNERDGSVTYRINRDNPVLQALQRNVGKEENKMLELLMSQIEATIPKFRIQNDIADMLEIRNSMDDAEEKVLISDLLNCLGMFPAEERLPKLDYFLCLEVYSRLKPFRDRLIRRLCDE